MARAGGAAYAGIGRLKDPPLFGIAGADSAASCKITSVQIDLDNLPDDPALLQQMLRQVVHEQDELQAQNDKLLC